MGRRGRGEPKRLPFGRFDVVDISGRRRGQSLQVGVRPPPPHESRTSAPPPTALPFPHKPAAKQPGNGSTGPGRRADHSSPGPW